MFTEHSTIQLYKAEKTDLETQLTTNSMTLQLKQKHSSVAIADIHQKYRNEQEFVKNEMNNTEDKTSNEYKELMAELKELRDNEDNEATAVEAEIKEAETAINLQNSSIETRLQAVQADLEGLEEMRKENIEKAFGYFQ